jgi:hypothetical protein
VRAVTKTVTCCNTSGLPGEGGGDAGRGTRHFVTALTGDFVTALALPLAVLTQPLPLLKALYAFVCCRVVLCASICNSFFFVSFKIKLRLCLLPCSTVCEWCECEKGLGSSDE